MMQHFRMGHLICFYVLASFLDLRTKRTRKLLMVILSSQSLHIYLVRHFIYFAFRNSIGVCLVEDFLGFCFLNCRPIETAGSS